MTIPITIVYPTTRVAAPRWKQEGVDLPNAFAQVEPYVDQPGVFFSMTSIEKLGINPKSTFQTPNGIYCYPLSHEIFDLWKVNKLPFVGAQPFINVFKTDGAGVIDAASKEYSIDQLDADIERIKTWYGAKSNTKTSPLEMLQARISALRAIIEKEHEHPFIVLHGDRKDLASPILDSILELASSEPKDKDKSSRALLDKLGELEELLIDELGTSSPTNKALVAVDGAINSILNPRSAKKQDVDEIIDQAIKDANSKRPFVQLWNITREVSGDAQKWNNLLRYLGINGVTDLQGTGTIHPNEPTQAVFLSKSGLTMIGRWDNPTSKDKIDKQTRPYTRFNTLVEAKQYVKARQVYDRLEEQVTIPESLTPFEFLMGGFKSQPDAKAFADAFKGTPLLNEIIRDLIHILNDAEKHKKLDPRMETWRGALGADIDSVFDRVDHAIASKGQNMPNTTKVSMREVFATRVTAAMVIIAGRLDDVKAKFPGRESEVDNLSRLDPSGQNKYLAYMTDQVLAKGQPQDHIVDLVERFNQQQTRLPKDMRDINRLSPVDLEDELDRIEMQPTHAEEKAKVGEGSKVIAKTPEYTIYEILSKDASCSLGRGTKWCITMKEQKYYEQYTDAGARFFFIITPATKYAIAASSSGGAIETFNANDDVISTKQLPAGSLDTVYKYIGFTPESAKELESKEPVRLPDDDEWATNKTDEGRILELASHPYTSTEVIDKALASFKGDLTPQIAKALVTRPEMSKTMQEAVLGTVFYDNTMDNVLEQLTSRPDFDSELAKKLVGGRSYLLRNLVSNPGVDPIEMINAVNHDSDFAVENIIEDLEGARSIPPSVWHWLTEPTHLEKIHQTGLQKILTLPDRPPEATQAIRQRIKDFGSLNLTDMTRENYKIHNPDKELIQELAQNPNAWRTELTSSDALTADEAFDIIKIGQEKTASPPIQLIEGFLNRDDLADNDIAKLDSLATGTHAKLIQKRLRERITSAAATSKSPAVIRAALNGSEEGNGADKANGMSAASRNPNLTKDDIKTIWGYAWKLATSGSDRGLDLISNLIRGHKDKLTKEQVLQLFSYDPDFAIRYIGDLVPTSALRKEKTWQADELLQKRERVRKDKREKSKSKKTSTIVHASSLSRVAGMFEPPPAMLAKGRNLVARAVMLFAKRSAERELERIEEWPAYLKEVDDDTVDTLDEAKDRAKHMKIGQPPIKLSLMASRKGYARSVHWIIRHGENGKYAIVEKLNARPSIWFDNYDELESAIDDLGVELLSRMERLSDQNYGPREKDRVNKAIKRLSGVTKQGFIDSDDSFSGTPTLRTRLPVDITGWRYEEQVNPQFVKGPKGKRSVDLTIVMGVDPKAQGDWSPDAWHIRVLVGERVKFDEIGLAKAIADAQSTFEHELAHAAQWFIGTAKGLKYQEDVDVSSDEDKFLGKTKKAPITRIRPGGLPSGSEKDPNAWNKDHAQRPVEFYPNAISEVNAFNQLSSQLDSPQERMDDARAWIAKRDRFKKLRTDNEQAWKKLVTEFMREVSRGPSPNRLANVVTRVGPASSNLTPTIVHASILDEGKNHVKRSTHGITIVHNRQASQGRFDVSGAGDSIPERRLTGHVERILDRVRSRSIVRFSRGITETASRDDRRNRKFDAGSSKDEDRGGDVRKPLTFSILAEILKQLGVTTKLESKTTIRLIRANGSSYKQQKYEDYASVLPAILRSLNLSAKVWDDACAQTYPEFGLAGKSDSKPSKIEESSPSRGVDDTQNALLQDELNQHLITTTRVYPRGAPRKPQRGLVDMTEPFSSDDGSIVDLSKPNRRGNVVTRVYANRIALKREEDEEGSHAGVFIPLPKDITKDFPEKEEDKSDPHFTVLYIGQTDPTRFDELADIVSDVASSLPPFDVKLSPGVDWFENDDGKSIAHKGVSSRSLMHMARLHERLKDAITSAGFPVKHYKDDTGFKAHSTLAYCDGRNYDGPVPEGVFPVDAVELWGFSKDVVCPLGRAQAKAARLERSPGMFRTAHLVQRSHNGKQEWCLVSKHDSSKILEWYGVEKPSAERVSKSEQRIHSFSGSKLATTVRRGQTKQEPWQMTQAEFVGPMKVSQPSQPGGNFGDFTSMLSNDLKPDPKSIQIVNSNPEYSTAIGAYTPDELDDPNDPDLPKPAVLLLHDGKTVGVFSGDTLSINPEHRGKGLSDVMIQRRLRDLKDQPMPKGEGAGRYSPAGQAAMKASHRRSVEQAIQEGRDVPDEVLKNYPALRKVSARSSDGIRRTAWGVYEGTINGHKVVIRREDIVTRGTYPGNKRQKRVPEWRVKLDGEEIGARPTFGEARNLASSACQPVTRVHASTVVRQSFITSVDEVNKKTPLTMTDIKPGDRVRLKDTDQIADIMSIAPNASMILIRIQPSGKLMDVSPHDVELLIDSRDKRVAV